MTETAPDPDSSWQRAAYWTLPVALWTAALCVSVVVLVFHFETWPSSVADSDRNRRGFELLLVKAGVVLGLLAAWPAYRRWVPPAQRATVRVWLFVIPLLLMLGAAGFLFVASAMRGTITG